MTMVEKVARAIHGSHGVMIPYDALSADQQYGMIVRAKAAIWAMRNPSPAMLNVGQVSSYLDASSVQNEDVYRAMIDAALKEE